MKRAKQIKGNRLASICDGRTKTWNEVVDRVARFAGALHSFGITAGQRVALLALNSDRHFEFFYAVPWAGGVFVPINIRLAAPEVEFCPNDSRSEVLLIDDHFLPILQALNGKLDSVEEVVYIGDGPCPDGLHGYEALIDANTPVEDVNRGYEDLAGLLYKRSATRNCRGHRLARWQHYARLLAAAGAYNSDHQKRLAALRRHRIHE
jgi:long-chain acyl-CoA synthetase